MSKETTTLPGEPFSRAELCVQVRNYQKRKYDLSRPSSAFMGAREFQVAKVLDCYRGPALELEQPLPDFQRHAQLDPLDAGDGSVFTADGKLNCRPLTICRDCTQYRTVTMAWRLALSNPLLRPGLASRDGEQLSRKVHTERLRFLSRLCVRRAKELRERACAIYRSGVTYRRNLFCAPTETWVVRQQKRAAVKSFCGLSRFCPYCWVHHYVTEPFFSFRALLIDKKPNGRPCLRSDRRLISVAQCWTRPAGTHPYELLRELYERRDELYYETPGTRTYLYGMAQLQYVEPPMSKTGPWRLHRRAMLICDARQPTYGYPHNGYDVRNDSYQWYAPPLEHVARTFGRVFTYPIALQVAPVDRVRQLLDAQVRWPHDREHGFQIFNTRGCMRRVRQAALEEISDEALDKDYETAQIFQD